MELFKEQLKKGYLEENFHIDRQVLAFSCGILFYDFEKRIHENNRKWCSLWGKVYINNWERLSGIIFDLFQKSNNKIFYEDKDIIKDIMLYFCKNISSFINYNWTKDDEYNFGLGYAYYM